MDGLVAASLPCVARSHELLSIQRAFVRDVLPRAINVKPIQGFEFGIDVLFYINQTLSGTAYADRFETVSKNEG